MSSETENQAQKRAHAEENGDDAVDAKSRKVENGQGKYESAFNMITTPEIICDVFSFLDKHQIERIQLVNQFWNNVIIRHKNILPLRKFESLDCYRNEIRLVATEEDAYERLSYKIKFDGTNLSKIDDNVSSRYLRLTVDEVLTNLNDVVFDYIFFDYIRIEECDSVDRLDYLLNMMKLVTTKTGGRFRGKFGYYFAGEFGSKLDEIFDNYIIVDELLIDHSIDDSYIREVCTNPEIVQLPLTPKEIRLGLLEFEENEEALHFTCNAKFNGANRLTIEFSTLGYYSAENIYSDTNNFIRKWFELYRTHENPISLVGKFQLGVLPDMVDSVLDAVKTLLNNTQLHAKYSLETTEVPHPFFIRRCVLHETDSYALVIEMTYRKVTDMSSINASDLDQPPRKMVSISFCVKLL